MPSEAYIDHVRDVLRADALPVTFGILICAVGIAGAALFFLRRKTQDKALVWFSLFACGYGIRLLLHCDSVVFALGLQDRIRDFLTAWISYGMPIPATLFLYEVSPTGRRTRRWVILAESVFAAAGIVSDVVQSTPSSLNNANNTVALVGVAALLFELFRKKSVLKIPKSLRTGVLVFFATVVLANLRGLHLVRFPFDPEPIGFVCFLGSLGQVLARRAMESEERLMLIEKELEVARRIQQSILPSHIPNGERIRIALHYSPMTAVAGDFYDFLIVDPNRLGILIADVSGHGVPAALIASMVKVAVAAQKLHADSPAQVLTEMNQILCGRQQGQFVTAAYLFLDLEAGKMRYAAAGHPALLWVKANAVEPVTENGLPLGIMAAAVYTATERSFEAGDRFLMYTDGVTEAARPDGEFYGEERLMDRLAQSRASGASVCESELVTSLARWRGQDNGGPQDDDLTLIVIDVGLAR